MTVAGGHAQVQGLSLGLLTLHCHCTPPLHWAAPALGNITTAYTYNSGHKDLL